MSRLAIIWACLAAILGFALGGSFVSSITPMSEVEKQRCYHGADAGHYKADECKTFWERSTTDPVAFYTLGLFLFTGILAVSTAFLWDATKAAVDGGEKQRESSERIAAAQRESSEHIARQQNALTRQAAEAATLSARAAIGIELPFLRIEPTKAGFGSSRMPDEAIRNYFIVAAVRISNIGRTRAVPVEIRCGWTFGDSLPEAPSYGWSTGFKVDTFIEPHPAEPVEFWIHELEMDVPEGAYTLLTERKAQLWFYICFAYLDFMQTRHEACFCWRRTEGFGVGQFVTDDTPAYNRKS